MKSIFIIMFLFVIVFSPSPSRGEEGTAPDYEKIIQDNIQFSRDRLQDKEDSLQYKPNDPTAPDPALTEVDIPAKTGTQLVQCADKYASCKFNCGFKAPTCLDQCLTQYRGCSETQYVSPTKGVVNKIDNKLQQNSSGTPPPEYSTEYDDNMNKKKSK